MPTPSHARPLLLVVPILLVLAACAGQKAASAPPPPAAPAARAASTAAGADDPGAPLRLTLVATNDLHGWVQPHETRLADGRVVRYGGAATFASYLARLREENPGGVLLLDAGDLFQGTLVANLSEGEAVIAAYNALGYDAVAIGNHEFDYGPLGPRSAAIDPADDPCGALSARAEQARFPLLGRNVYLESGERPCFLRNDGTHLVERHGIKIGIVGLLTPLTPQVTNPVNVSSLRFGELASEARAAVQALHGRGAQILVALVHAGGRCGSLDDPRDLTSCDSKGEIFQMLNALPPGLFDAVVAAHSHTRLAHFVNGMPVVQSGAYGTQFGTITLEIDRKTRAVRREATRIVSGVPICEKVYPGTQECDPKRPSPGELVPASFRGKPVVPDPAVAAALKPYLDRVEKEQQRLLGVHVPKALTRNYHGESLLGNALADSVRAMEGSDVVLLNPGGLRRDLPAGPLTFGEAFEVFPFDNTVATLTLTGEEIVGLLEALLGSGHGAPQVSGVKLKVARCPGAPPRIAEISFASGPRAFDRAATYKLTTSDFLALGGDGVGKVLEKVPAARKDMGHFRPLNMRDALAAWLQKKGGNLEAQLDGRLVIDSTCAGAGK